MGMMRSIGRFCRHSKTDDSGSVAVEFALTLPVYFGAIMFVMEMGRLAFIQGTVIHAAEEATRFALVNYSATAADIQARARANLLGLEEDKLTAILITDPVDPADQTRLVTVEIQYQYEPILPFLFFISDSEGDGSISLVGTSRGVLTEEIPSL